MIYAVLVSDSDITKHGLREILASTDSISLTGITGSFRECELLVTQRVPDVIILDMSLNSVCKIEELTKFVNDIRALSRRIGFVCVTDWSNKYFFNLSKRLDIKGYCLRTIDGTDLIRAVKVVSKGGIYIHDEYTKALTDCGSLLDNLNDVLGKRQMQVFKLVLLGYTNQEIADHLYISLPTVKSHIRVILRKLNARDRAQAISLILKDMLDRPIWLTPYLFDWSIQECLERI